jgi:endonuclease/exonuclease/phosphatase (EEP) superfamily protein YafD
MGFLRVVFWALVAPALFLIAAASAIGAVGGHLGREDLEWDVLAHFAPVWMAGGLLGIFFGSAFPGFARITLLLLSAVATVASSGLMAPEFLRTTGPTAPAYTPRAMKIIQANLWFHSTEPQVTLDWLFGQGADILVLQETSPEMRKALVARPGWHVTCPTCEVMILSRKPPIRAKTLRRLGPTPGPLTRAVFRDAQGEFAVIGVHHAWPTDAADQQAQEESLAKVIAMSGTRRAIVAGDFNSTPWSFSRQRWDAAFGLIRRDRAIFTWPARQAERLRWLAPVPFLPLDHVYAGQDWATVRVERGPRLGSDHYPLVAVLAPIRP